MDAFTILILIVLSWIIVGVCNSNGSSHDYTEYDPKGWGSLKDLADEIRDRKEPQTVDEDNRVGYQYNGLL